jgi:muramoyltetrapeptide carboxypeptidase LdcA involved in peptidoglycan recycling
LKGDTQNFAALSRGTISIALASSQIAVRTRLTAKRQLVRAAKIGDLFDDRVIDIILFRAGGLSSGSNAVAA